VRSYFYLAAVSLFLFIPPRSVEAQTAEPQYQPLHPTSPFSVPTRSVRTRSIDDDRAKDLVVTILSQYGLKLDDQSWEIWVTNDRDETPNAAANVGSRIGSDGRPMLVRQIYFNRTFVERISNARADNWTLYAIAAHEVAHQLGNHVLRSGLPTQLAEREADYHSGFVISRMGAPYGRATEVVRWLPGGQAQNYPSRSQRLCEIGRGWRDGQRLEQIASASIDAARPEFCEDKAPDPAMFKTRINRDIHGHDIQVNGRPFIPGIDLAACAARCRDMAECRAFSFDRWQGYCYLKDKIDTSYADPPSTIGVKQPAELPNVSKTAPSEMIIVRNRLFTDTPRKPPELAETFDACRETCNTSRDCVAFSYVKLTRLCSHFDRTIGHYVDERADSGYKRQVRPGQTPVPSATRTIAPRT
jgi:hypothetical protein